MDTKTFPLISVIVSTFNRADRLKKAIQSIIDQNYPNIEIVVVDDASTDDTSKVVKAFRDKRIIYIKRKKNFGSDTQPKNDGIKASHGEYIAFLDDDNVYNPDALRIRYIAMEKNPLLDVVYTDRLIIDESGQVPSQVGINSDFNVSLLFQRNYIDMSDVLIKRKSLFFVGGFDERYKKYVDWNLWIRMAKAGMKFHHIPKVTLEYHLHPDMKSLRVKDREIGKTPIGLSNPTPVFRPEWDPRELEIQLEFLGELKDPTVAIFTLTHGRLDYLKKTFEGLKKAGYPFQWYVIDQASGDGTVEWLKSLKLNNLHLIENKENTGISVGSNQALDAIGDTADFIIKIDDDCSIHSDKWLFEMLRIFQKNYTMALSPYVEGLVENAGGSPRLGYGTISGHTIGITHHIGGIFTMTHKSAYFNWRWDKDDFLHSFQDVIFTQHLKEIQYVCGYVEDMRVEHIDSTDGQKEKYKEYFERRKLEKTRKYEKRKI